MIGSHTILDLRFEMGNDLCDMGLDAKPKVLRFLGMGIICQQSLVIVNN